VDVAVLNMDVHDAASVNSQVSMGSASRSCYRETVAKPCKKHWAFPKNLDARAALRHYFSRRQRTDMPTHRLGKVLEHLHHTLAPPGDALTDGQLLARFVAGGDEAAFALLLRRHGQMVLGVCRRVLRHAQDAEDAFQATFFVLARRAASVRKREALGSWLYSVAYRTAQGARRMRARRWAAERQVGELPHPQVEPVEVEDWRPLLDRELSRLPEKYRAPLVLCELEGRSRKEVARELRLPEGTLSSRLAMARRLLAKRLTFYGPAFLGGVPAENGASASVPAALFLSTTKAAMLISSGQAAVAGVASAEVAALTKGVLKTMFLAKLKTVAVVLCGMAALGLGTGGVLYQARGGGPAAALQAGEKPKDKDTRAADDKAAREEAQRDQLEALRRQVEELKAEAEKQRRRAEEAELKAKEVMDALKRDADAAREAELEARKQAERALYAAELRQAQAADDLKAANSDDRVGQALAELVVKKAQLMKKFEERRRALEEEQRKALAELQAQEDKWKEQAATAKAPQQPPKGDKLDQILERLERLEKRLDKLERKE
jgi:RNA polymerase sigma factor (sigma-70 family)